MSPDLGKTPALLAMEEDCNNTMVWISYWKSVDHLHAFAQGDVHRAGWDWWNGNKKYPHIGIQHEMYYAPRGHWENIAYNFRPFGFGRLILNYGSYMGKSDINFR